MPDDNAATVFSKVQRHWVWIAAGLLVCLIGGAGLWWLLTPHKLHVWKPTTVPYAASCVSGCKTIGAFAPDHGGTPPANPADVPRLVYNPKVDDAVAQWGDCLQSVMSCVTKQPRGSAGGVNACVARAQCPEACKERFSRQTAGDIGSARKALFGVFINKDAVCRPEDGNG